MTLHDRLAPILSEIVGSGMPLPQAMTVIEQKLIDEALRLSSGNVTRAAKSLGIHRNTLHHKLQMRAANERIELTRKIAQTRRSLAMLEKQRNEMRR